MFCMIDVLLCFIFDELGLLYSKAFSRQHESQGRLDMQHEIGYGKHIIDERHLAIFLRALLQQSSFYSL